MEAYRMGRWHRLVILALSLLALLPALPASAQSIDPPLWWTADGGGVVFSTGLYKLGATLGQPDAAAQADSGIYSTRWGYWSAEPAQRLTTPVGSTEFQRKVTFGDLWRLVCAGLLVASVALSKAGKLWNR
jgi:hypothetical protein